MAVVGHVGGAYLRDTPTTSTPGAGRGVNVTGQGYLLTGRSLLFNGTTVIVARNVHLGGTRHYALPADPKTFAVVSDAFATCE